MKMYSDKPIRMALIATYPEMSKIFLHMAGKKDNVVAIDEYASFEDAVKVAQKIEHEVDIILSRGGTAEYIRKSVSVPVVYIPITPFDVVLAMQKLDRDVKEVALSHFANRIFGVDEIQKMYGVRIHEYVFQSRDDIEKNILDAKDRGIKVIIGGEVAVRIALEYGLSGMDLSAGTDTVNRAIDEAVSIVKASRQERDRATRLTAALNALTEGLVVTDEDNRVIICNPAARKMLGDNARMGGAFVPPHADIDLDKARQAPQLDQMRDIGGVLVSNSLIPVRLDDRFIGMVHTFEDVTKIQNLERDIRSQLHDKGFVARHRFADIATGDQGLKTLIEIAAMYAQTDSAILIEGESGTGKELFAQSLHNASNRADGPFVAVNCAAIPDNLLESELFGYEAGAFTGARKEGKRGLFEMAHRGTIFLDEIGEIPKALQSRLLRVLQEKELMRIGGARVIPVDTRIISATNRNLREQAARGEFRDDLYYRLAVFNLFLPPLRDRAGDIETLCRMFLERLRVTVDPARLKPYLPTLLAYNWPGNIRELQNVSERLSFLLTHPLYDNIRDGIAALGLHQGAAGGGFAVDVDVRDGLKRAIELVEWEIIDHLLKANNDNHNAVANILKIGRSTLWRKYTQSGTE